MKYDEPWVRIYWDYCPDKKKLLPYLRITPTFMCLEDSGYPHGVSLSKFYDTREEAQEAQEFYKKFFDAMIKDYEINRENLL